MLKKRSSTGKKKEKLVQAKYIKKSEVLCIAYTAGVVKSIQI